MPVGTGYGSPTLDYLGACHGQAFAIETKAPGKGLSPRQEGMLDDMANGGITVFIIDGPPGFRLLEAWLRTRKPLVKCRLEITMGRPP